MKKYIVHMDEDLWVDILKRVPVKSLCRFRCVCKSWNSLIISPRFAIDQLSSSIDKLNKPYLLFNTFLGPARSYALYNPDPQDSDLTFHPIPFRFQMDNGVVEVHGVWDIYYRTVVDVVHGIVCLSENPLRSSTNTTVVWNPSIHRYINIPRSSSFNGGGGWICKESNIMNRSSDIGFGFDRANNAFKLVRIWHHQHHHCRCDEYMPKFEVLTLSFGGGGRDLRWRSVVCGDIGLFDFYKYKSGFFINGAIHWVVKKRNINDQYYENRSTWKMLLVFDCGLEEFKTMELPQGLKSTAGRMTLFAYRGMLTLFAVKDTILSPTKEELEEWAMEEYGMASSWKKLKPEDENFLSIEQRGVSKLLVGALGRPLIILESIDLHGFEGSHHPLNGHIFEESLFMGDVDNQAMSYTMINRDDEDGDKVSEVVDGTRYDYIRFPASTSAT